MSKCMLFKRLSDQKAISEGNNAKYKMSYRVDLLHVDDDDDDGPMMHVLCNWQFCAPGSLSIMKRN